MESLFVRYTVAFCMAHILEKEFKEERMGFVQLVKQNGVAPLNIS